MLSSKPCNQLKNLKYAVDSYIQCSHCQWEDDQQNEYRNTSYLSLLPKVYLREYFSTLILKNRLFKTSQDKQYKLYNSTEMSVHVSVC